eukprot:TRINITY_DN6034_c0_g1_i1.p1 TRINITY_DN6034_c0_g1~~TRINITY_DN6034_c0_g1_i1.p1  ORF type:complete len:175 (+),score=56.64 TRINITY_DN6034_c0_g1_i1:180-704(+)
MSAPILITLLGGGVGGKSALVHRLMNDSFMDQMNDYFEEKFTKRIKIDGKEVELEVLDTPGQEEYSAMLESWISGAEGVMLVYRINCRNSFAEIVGRDLINKINQVPILLVGSWCDKEGERMVSSEEGQFFAEKHGLAFIEVSSLTGHNVNLAFETMGRMVLKKRDEKSSGKKK